jgi:Ca2+-binding RTX toxin-like protein
MALIEGGNGADTLDGTAGNDTVKGFGGNDTLNGLLGLDIIDGGTGDDLLDGGDDDDQLLGGIGLDTLAGGSGNDRLDGGAGIDSMTGGTGDDTYVVENAADVVTELFGEGVDTIEASVSYTLSADVDNLTLVTTRAVIGTGNALDNSITGNAAANKLFGMDGNDTLNGGTGIDSLTGGLGDDMYIVDNKADKIFENDLEGADTVTAFTNYTLGAFIETLVLATGVFTATPALAGTGNTLDNTIIGTAGNNTLDGAAGVDTLIGALGNDIYIVDNANDLLTENLGEGEDTARASVTYSLDTQGANVEGLTLTGTAAIDGTGNGLANILTGNTAVNTLDGGAGEDTLNGGAGADVMIGGLNSDTYYIDNAADTIIENGGEGNDRIFTGITYNLGLNAAEVEIVTLTGTAAIGATGNGSDNTITGNAGANIINGGAGDDSLNGGNGNDVLNGDADNDTLDGGAGRDTMRGGTGDDVYIVNAATGKVIVELAGEGIDEVRATVSHVLAAEVDNLVLTGVNLNGTGNAIANTLTGTTGNNTLDGMAGVDTLIGNGGNDVFIVDDAGDVVTGETTMRLGIILSSATRDLSVNTDFIDQLTLTGMAAIDGTGNNNANTITGNVAVNNLSGLDGDDVFLVDANDIVDGGNDSDTVVVNFTASTLNANWTSIENITLTGTALLNATGDAGNNTLLGNSGRNTLDGGLGDDTYGITTGDVIIDTGGNDTVRVAATYTLIAGMENITLTGTGNFNAFGDAGVNILTGNTGNNTLDGRGGVDTLVGGRGNDTYIIDDINIRITENAGEGQDTVRTALGYTLLDPDRENVENIVLLGAASVNIVGNARVNTLTGNSGDNTIDGDGGADVMAGGAGDDVFIVDSIGETASDTSGFDVVLSSADHTLGLGIENLTLTSTAAVLGTGNNLRNVITGSDGNNTLDGMAGVDTLVGGLGDDLYIVDSVSDVVIENIGEGFDAILSSVSYTLPQDVEYLDLFETYGNLTGIGNGIDNTLEGGFGNDILRGLGGDDVLFGTGGADTLYGGDGDDVLFGDDSLTAGPAAVDVMYGGEGADLFVFTAETYVPPLGKWDFIMDYSLAEGDMISLFDVLDGTFSSATDDIEDFLNITNAGFLQVDTSGSGGAGGWVTIARILGVNDITDVDFFLPP